MTPIVQTPSATTTIDAARLRAWAQQVEECLGWCPSYFRYLPPLLRGLREEITAAAAAIEADEAAFAADLDRQFRELFPHLDDGIPTVLPVQPRIDHPFGCQCGDCCKAVAS